MTYMIDMNKPHELAEFSPTPEQVEIIAHPPDSPLLVEAGAGTGKTTTLDKYARRWKDRKALYIAYNTAIANASRSRFPKNVTVKTAHGYAYQILGISKYQDRLTGKIRKHHIRELNLELHHSYMSGDRMMKSIIMGIENYTSSAGSELTAQHCGLNGLPTNAAMDILNRIIAPVIKKFLDYETSGLPFTHDIYLKKLEIKGSIGSEYDYVMVDEAQDMSEVLLSLLRKSGKPVIYIGDRFQSIYAFRGAIDALSKIDAPRKTLTQSWRFGAPVDTIANQLLQKTTNPPDWKLLGKPGHQTVVRPYHGSAPGRSFILSRTNARLFEGLVNVKTPFHVSGGFEIIASQVMSAFSLSRGDRSGIKDPLIQAYTDWDDMVADADENDPEVRRLVRIIKDYGSEIPAIIERLRQLNRPRADDANLTMSTAHKAKGLEAPVVVILDDFHTPSELFVQYESKVLKEIDYNQELHLMYVALTRAIDTMFISEPLYGEIMNSIQRA